jgi:hypothetical protein|tara:strand:+ start:115 stop:522 length:408 start_codon:yes stop_codon:yes gene_type:complete
MAERENSQVGTPTDPAGGILVALTDEIKQLRSEMHAGFEKLGKQISQRKDAQHGMELKCGQHRGGFEVRIHSLETGLSDHAQDFSREGERNVQRDEKIKALEDQALSGRVLLKVAVFLGTSGAAALVWQALRALG